MILYRGFFAELTPDELYQIIMDGNMDERMSKRLWDWLERPGNPPPSLPLVVKVKVPSAWPRAKRSSTSQ